MEALSHLATWPVAEAAAGMATVAGRLHMAGDTSRPFAWASVTKPVCALAVLVAVEEGSLSLDGPAGPPGSTVRHLLAHASGLGLEGDRPLGPPGRRRRYSNDGFRVLAATLASATGMAFGDYVSEGVLRPLGMAVTARGGAGDGATGMVGPLTELLVLGREFLTPSLVSAATLGEATGVAFPGLAGVLPGYGPYDPCDWGLGVEVRDAKSPHWTGRSNSPATFGHFGRSGSFVWVDPVAGVTCAALCDRPFGPWAADAWPALSDAVLEELAPSD